MENSFLFNCVKDNTNFIKLNDVKNEILLTNKYNNNEYNETTNNNFIPFTGNGIKLGGN